MKYFNVKKQSLSIIISLSCLVIILNMESCSTKQGLVSCPNLYHAPHHQIAMRKAYRQAGNTSAAKPAAAPQNAGQNINGPATLNSVQPVGIASLSNNAQVPKSPKKLFEALTGDQRQQVKEEISNMLKKAPVIQKVALKRFDKLDKKFPAPREHPVHSGDNGGLVKSEKLAIAAFVLSLTITFSLIGFILGIVALVQMKQDDGRLWAKILSILAIVFGFMGFALLAAVIITLLLTLFLA